VCESKDVGSKMELLSNNPDFVSISIPVWAFVGISITVQVLLAA
jgi:hypothetical protein